MQRGGPQIFRREVRRWKLLEAQLLAHRGACEKSNFAQDVLKGVVLYGVGLGPILGTTGLSHLLLQLLEEGVVLHRGLGLIPFDLGLGAKEVEHGQMRLQSKESGIALLPDGPAEKLGNLAVSCARRYVQNSVGHRILHMDVSDVSLQLIPAFLGVLPALDKIGEIKGCLEVGTT